MAEGYRRDNAEMVWADAVSDLDIAKITG